MLARDVMTANPMVLTPEEPIARAAEVLRDFDVGMLPVVADRSSLRLVGLITDRDITVRCVARRHAGQCRVREHMTIGSLATAEPDESLELVIERMERARVRRIPIVAANGRLVGIISQADLATRFGQDAPAAIEELLKEISEPADAPS